MKIVITTALSLALAVMAISLVSANDKAEYTECADGYFWRGTCIQVSGCPYGDSIPIDQCKPPEQPQNAPAVELAPDYSLPAFEGK